MGASLGVANDLHRTYQQRAIEKKKQDSKYVLQVTTISPPNYNFEQFMNLCERLQQEKKSLELHIRMEIENWRVRANEGSSTAESRHRINEMLGKFKNAQETQDMLIEKERLRMDQQRAEGESEEIKSKIKRSLNFFSHLNQEHERLLARVREDVADCRSIHGKITDPRIRYRVPSKT